jgi:REP element-mobilizing transposase RayT
MPQPIYTNENTKPAYQLRWSLALFTRQAIPPADEWLEPLKAVLEQDEIRVLEHCQQSDKRFFLLSTLPTLAPAQIVKLVKGRLQYLIRDRIPKAFHRHFRLTSIGDANREAIERYVSDQLGHHRMADARVNELLKDFQFAFPDVDLGLIQRSSHGQYLYNLHLVLIHADRWREIRRERLQVSCEMIIRCARAKNHHLSRLAVLTDHFHLTLGVPYDVSPGDVALGYMNNVAFAHGMIDLFMPSYYVGTFGQYDMNAVRS